MNIRSASQNKPKELPVLAVLGLTGRGTDEWAQLRGFQYAQLARVARSRLLTQAIAAIVTLCLFYPVINHALLAGWLGALCGSLTYTTRSDWSLSDADRRRVARDELMVQAAGTAINALVWSVPMLLFAPHAEHLVRFELWTIVAMLMTVSAVIIPTVPLATLLFSAIIGGASVYGLVISQEANMAGIAGLFVVIIGLGAVEASRHFLISRLATAGMAERNEVVSLLLREFEEGESDWLWQVDPKRRVCSVSRRFAVTLGMEVGEIEGQNFLQLISGNNWNGGKLPPSIHELSDRLKRRESFSNLLVRVMIKGEMRWWEVSGTPTFDGFRGVASDVTEQRDSTDKIAYLSRFDTLTGLPNRMMITEAIGDALRYSQQWRTKCAFLMLDLDRFKAVNDTLGHLVGDQLLARVSERLRQMMTDNELCGRLGGDEFAIVIRDASDLARVARVANGIIERLSEPYTVDHHTLYVGASVGSAVGPADGSSVEELMRNADLALYRAKDGGGGRHCAYEPGLHAQAEERRKLEASLRMALERDEFILHYQPVVDASSEAVVSFEALVRWNSRDHGMVSPAKFVPLAEDTRLIVPIGEWVMREACREAVKWPSVVKVAVNVSGEQLLEPKFLDLVVSALAVSGLPPQRLEIEVTESLFLRDASMARAALERLLALGCGVSLDDFGTGYSSLGYLRKLRFTTIKVDRSFVKGAAVGNPESLAIIRAVVAMADSLEMSTTAEGVETEEELATVRRLGCKKIQGFYYGRPMASADVSQLCTRQKRFYDVG